MKNISIERVIFGSFEFPLFGTLKVHKSLWEADFCFFLTEGCQRQNFNYILQMLFLWGSNQFQCFNDITKVKCAEQVKAHYRITLLLSIVPSVTYVVSISFIFLSFQPYLGWKTITLFYTKLMSCIKKGKTCKKNLSNQNNQPDLMWKDTVRQEMKT